MATEQFNKESFIHQKKEIISKQCETILNNVKKLEQHIKEHGSDTLFPFNCPITGDKTFCYALELKTMYLEVWSGLDASLTNLNF